MAEWAVSGLQGKGPVSMQSRDFACGSGTRCSSSRQGTVRFVFAGRHHVSVGVASMHTVPLDTFESAFNLVLHGTTKLTV